MASASKKILFNKVQTATENGVATSIGPKAKSFIGYVKLTGRGQGDYTAKIEHSPNGSDWYEVAAFAQLTADGTEVKQITTNIFPNIRAQSTVANGPGDGTLLVELWYDEDR